MNIKKSHFSAAVEKGIVSKEQADTLWEFLMKVPDTQRKFNTTNIIYYMGALIVIASMAWFMTKAWSEFNGALLALIAIAYAMLFTWLGNYFWGKEDFRIPGGLLFTAAVSMTPLAVYGIQKYFGIWPQKNPGDYGGYHVWINGSWILLEIGTVLAGIVYLRFRKFIFLTAPVMFSLWYLSMDLTGIIYQTATISHIQRCNTSILVGFIILVITFIIDRRTKDDYAFWGYIFGMIAFWGGLSAKGSDSEVAKFIYCLMNVGFVMLAPLIGRRVFAVFGALGIFGYLTHLSSELFKDSLLFPFILSGIGLGIIYLGVVFQKNERRIKDTVSNILPQSVRNLLPENRSAQR